MPAAIERYEIETQTRSHANFSAEQKADAFATSDVLLSPVVNTQETFGLSLDEP